MRIGIVTRPLLTNYGGILQNFALQQALRKLGHEPITIDFIPSYSLYRYLRSFCKTLLLWPIPWKRRPFVSYRRAAGRSSVIDNFCKKHITLTERVTCYIPMLVERYGMEAVITGSDQVWRAKYNLYPEYLKDMYLRFVRQSGVKKLAYAASFGIDVWDYSSKMTETCRRLVKEFTAISVREESAIAMCREYLDVEATEVLDPTLLLDKTEYEALCHNIPVDSSSFIAVYILDKSLAKLRYIQKIALQIDLPIKVFSAHHDMTLSIEKWLAMFRDAQYVVTDSFHGTVFSIIFNKPFWSIGNTVRGMARFNSLLALFGLQKRLCTLDMEYNVSSNIDWELVNEKRYLLQKKSFDFLNQLDKR